MEPSLPATIRARKQRQRFGAALLIRGKHRKQRLAGLHTVAQLAMETKPGVRVDRVAGPQTARAEQLHSPADLGGVKAREKAGARCCVYPARSCSG